MNGSSLNANVRSQGVVNILSRGRLAIVSSHWMWFEPTYLLEMEVVNIKLYFISGRNNFSRLFNAIEEIYIYYFKEYIIKFTS
jgi:hypothetical protein